MLTDRPPISPSVQNFLNFLDVIIDVKILIDVLRKRVIFCDMERDNEPSSPSFTHAIKYTTFTFELERNYKPGQDLCLMTNLQPTMDNLLAIKYGNILTMGSSYISAEEWNRMIAAIEDKWQSSIDELTYGLLGYV